MKYSVAWECEKPPYVVNTNLPCKGTFELSLKCATCPFSKDSETITEVKEDVEPNASGGLQHDQEG